MYTVLSVVGIGLKHPMFDRRVDYNCTTYMIFFNPINDILDLGVGGTDLVEIGV